MARILDRPAVPASDQPSSLRRRDERHAIRATALAYCHGRFQTVRIIDYSPGGLQLQGCFGVSNGDEITIELLSGQRLPAKVMWSMGSRLGVRFLEPLDNDHPVLVALALASRRVAGTVGEPKDGA